MKDLLEQMSHRVLRHFDGTRRETDVPRLGIGAVWPRKSPAAGTCGAGVCLVLQGAKQMLVATRSLRYVPGQFFASVVELPTLQWVFETSAETPYVATSLTLDYTVISELLPEASLTSPSRRSAALEPVAAPRPLLEAWDHYLALLEIPDDVAVLAPLRERELLYRLLQSPIGPLLRQTAGEAGSFAQVRRAIDWIRAHFGESTTVSTLAEIAGMSVPSFNRHFRAATSTSPLQYQKTLRLQAARRMLSTNADATTAAYAVGYESASQFSREYLRLFGRPPKQDAAHLRANVGELSEVLI